MIEKNLIKSAHDVSLGGIITALSKMSILGNKGFKLNKLKILLNKFEYFFGEDQGRYILEISKNNLEKVETILKENSVYFDQLGVVTSKEIIIDNEPIFNIDELIQSNTSWLKKYMAQ